MSAPPTSLPTPTSSFSPAEALALLDAIGEQAGLLRTDLQHRVVSVNARLCQLLARTESELLGSWPRGLRFGKQRRDLGELRQPGGTWLGDVLCKRPGGDTLVLAAWVIRLHSERHGFDGFLGVYTDVTDERQQSFVHSFAGTDLITGLDNREAFIAELTNLLNDSQDEARPGAFLLVSIDGFDDLATSVGYGISLALRAAVADRLIERVESSSSPRGQVAAFSDHEFAVVLPAGVELVDQGELDVDTWANQLRRALREPLVLAVDDKAVTRLSITVSIGVALWRAPAAPDDLIEQARVALWRARHDGRDRVAIYSQTDAQQVERENLIETHLLDAIEDGALQIHLQPQVGLAGNVAAAEVLARWLDGRGRPVHEPKDFIPVAERTGLVLPLGEHVLRRACEVLAKWQALGSPLCNVELAVNVSAHEFSQVDFADKVLAILEESGAPAGRLWLEVTETAVMVNMDLAARTMDRLESAGLRFALDDFGVGHASLLYLMKLPISQIKIDQAFILKLPRPGERASDEATKALGIVKTMARLCHDWTWTLVAEGVSSPDLAQLTKDLRCDYRQGYHFARAMPIGDFEAFVQARA